MSQSIADEIEQLRARIEFNRRAAQELAHDPDVAHDYWVVAHTLDTVVDRLQRIQDGVGEYHYSKEKAMNKVKSLAGTGKGYCQFTIEVAGGDWGQPRQYFLVQNGGCGATKRIPLTGLDLPVAPPAGKYTMQAKLVSTDGGCGEKSSTYAHVQFPFPNGVEVEGNRDYGWAFETESPELIAALG